jgi:ABC-type transporter Mla subunit MlaD
MAMSSELKVGALFFVGLGLSVWFTLQTTKTSNGKGEYSVEFKRVARLAPGDQVLYNGVRIGKIAAVAPVLDGKGEPRVRVSFSVDGPARSAVLVGDLSSVRINQGVLGGASMEILSTAGKRSPKRVWPWPQPRTRPRSMRLCARCRTSSPRTATT